MELSTKISNLRRQLVNEYNISEEVQETFIALQQEAIGIPPKPILVIGLPIQDTDSNTDVAKGIKENFDDYHVIVHTHYDLEVKIKVFYQKDFTEVDLFKLRELLTEIK